MKKKVAYVVNGFLELNEEDREELVRAINKYIEGTVTEEALRRSFPESVLGSTRMTLGPSPNGCPCCGK